MPAGVDDGILEAGELLHLHLVSVIGGNDGASAGSAEIDGEIVVCAHYSDRYL